MSPLSRKWFRETLSGRSDPALNRRLLINDIKKFIATKKMEKQLEKKSDG